MKPLGYKSYGRKGKVDFLCKYVRPTKVDGKYLDQDIFNEMPEEFDYLKY
jgi:hypothetical protein